MKLKGLSILGLVMVMLSSCWKEDDKYILPGSSNPAVKQQQVLLGGNYDKIAYFNVQKNSFIIKNIADWDLAFQCGENELHLKINGGKQVRAFKTPNTDFDEPYTFIGGEEWKCDMPSGNLDSTAIGKWWDANGKSEKSVYLIDMGTQVSPRYRKFQIQKADATGYWIKVGLHNVTGGTDIFVPKDATRNYSYLNATSGEVTTDFEPEKDNWDLVFTRYIHIFYDQGPTPLPYEVTGVLLNPNKVKAYMERTKTFEDIDLDYALSITYTDSDESIGYDWKDYNQTTGKYTTDKTRTYIIKTVGGLYYKLRFLDFYSPNGVKGSPLFDLQQL